MLTVVGWMSPIASPATSAYGTLVSCSRGVISGSDPTVTPRYRSCPFHTEDGTARTLPSSVEK
jgi:hypothetical protein